MLGLFAVRVAGLISLVLAYRLAAGLAGPASRARIAAGSLAALSLLLTPSWLRYLAGGNEAPAVVALALGALDRHLAGSWSLAYVLLVVACLARPEAFVLVLLYGSWLWLIEPRRRPLVAGLLLTLPLLWLVPEWIGSGDLLGGGRQAASAPSWTLAADDTPWLAALRRAHHLLGIPVEVGALAALGYALVRRQRLELALAAAALGWFGLVAAMTQAGFSGDARYYAVPLALTCVLAGAGVVQLAGRIPRRSARLAVAGLALAAWLPAALEGGDRLARQLRSAERVAALHRDLERALARVGGPAAVRKRGPATINRVFETHLAWTLGAPLSEVEGGRGQGFVFLARGPGAGPGLSGRVELARRSRRLMRVGGWTVLRPQDPASVRNAATYR